MTITPVIQLTHCVDMPLIARLFAKFRGRYGNLWTSRASCDDDWEFIMEDWLEELSKFTLDQVRAAINKSLSAFKEYPPTLGQIIDLCLKESGVPSQQEVIRAMVARDFSHPLVKIIYDKLGSWTLINAKSDEIERKVKEHYITATSEFHVDPQKAWTQLEDFNAKPKELPAPEKTMTAEERKGFKERMAEYQKKVEEEKERIKDKRQKEFDYTKLQPGSRDFDQLLFSEYKAYLIGIPETMVLSLSVTDAYARMKFLSMVDQSELLKKAGYIPPKERDGFASPKASDRSNAGKPVKMYKNWAHD